MSQQRSFGPFSGLQLTAIIIVALVVIGVPGSVYAIDTFSNVAVEDPVSGVKASVDTQHRLKTLDTVTGTVAAPDTPPANPVHFEALMPSTCGTPIYTVPAGKALILQSATMLEGPATSGVAEVVLVGDAACTIALDKFASTAGSTLQHSYGSGLVVKGQLYGFAAQGKGEMFGFGYLVPANSVPTATAARAGHRRIDALPGG